jgi:hypothetical protein
MYARGLTLMIAGFAAIGVAHAQRPVGPQYEGAWYVADDTDNNTGERQVYAFLQRFVKDEYVTLRMRCTDGKPMFLVEWADQTFPDQTVVTLGTSADEYSEPTNRQYVFEQSKDAVDPWLRASPETTAKIVADIGEAEFVSVTAYQTSGKRTVGMDTAGTQQAWARVSRHCPVRKMARPPK